MASLIRYNPFRDMFTLERTMDRFWQDSRRHPLHGFDHDGNSVESHLSLPVDLYETDETVVLKARIPGINPEDVEINIDGERLTLKAELRSDATLEGADKWRWYHHELAHGTITRSLALPTQIEADKAEASFRNGELTLELPKAEAVKPRTIKVKAIP